MHACPALRRGGRRGGGRRGAGRRNLPARTGQYPPLHVRRNRRAGQRQRGRGEVQQADRDVRLAGGGDAGGPTDGGGRRRAARADQEHGRILQQLVGRERLDDAGNLLVESLLLSGAAGVDVEQREERPRARAARPAAAERNRAGRLPVLVPAPPVGAGTGRIPRPQQARLRQRRGRDGPGARGGMDAAVDAHDLDRFAAAGRELVARRPGAARVVAGPPQSFRQEGDAGGRRRGQPAGRFVETERRRPRAGQQHRARRGRAGGDGGQRRHRRSGSGEALEIGRPDRIRDDPDDVRARRRTRPGAGIRPVGSAPPGPTGAGRAEHERGSRRDRGDAPPPARAARDQGACDPRRPHPADHKPRLPPAGGLPAPAPLRRRAPRCYHYRSNGPAVLHVSSRE